MIIVRLFTYLAISTCVLGVWIQRPETGRGIGSKIGGGKNERDILTNAQRLASGLTPALPKALRDLVPSKSSRNHLVKSPSKRQGACPSSSPIVFPPKPEDPRTVLPTPNSGVYAIIDLPWKIKMFNETDTVLYVNEDGRVSLFGDFYSFPNQQLPSGYAPSYTVFAYWDDLYAMPEYDDQNVYYSINGTSITLRYRLANVTEDQIASFILYYSTESPGRWYVYFEDDNTATGGSATIGAQGGERYVMYQAYEIGTVRPGLRIAIDTNCEGSIITTG